MAAGRRGLTKRLPWAPGRLKLAGTHFPHSIPSLCLDAGLTLEFVCAFPQLRLFARAAQIGFFLTNRLFPFCLPWELQLWGSACASDFWDDQQRWNWFFRLLLSFSLRTTGSATGREQARLLIIYQQLRLAVVTAEPFLFL